MHKDDKKNQDMSVEDILKSIKGVINNRRNDYKSFNQNDSDILELTEVLDENEDDAIEKEFDLDNDFLISSKSASETSNALKNLKHKINNKHDSSSINKKNALEEIVIEMLRPELKLWLDENLPLLVRQLVEREIKKLILNNKK